MFVTGEVGHFHDRFVGLDVNIGSGYIGVQVLPGQWPSLDTLLHGKACH